MFNFDNFPIKLSGKTVNYICPKCKYKGSCTKVVG